MRLVNKKIFFRLCFTLVYAYSINLFPLSNISAFIRTCGVTVAMSGVAGLITYCLVLDEVTNDMYGNAYTTIDPLRKINCALYVAKIFGTLTLITSGAICASQTPYIYFWRSKYDISGVEKDSFAATVLRNCKDKSSIKNKLREFCGNFLITNETIVRRLNEDRNRLQQAIYLLILARREQRNNNNFMRRCDELIDKARKIRDKIDEAILIIKGVE